MDFYSNIRIQYGPEKRTSKDYDISIAYPIQPNYLNTKIMKKCRVGATELKLEW
jgi:hypothetical protein